MLHFSRSLPNDHAAFAGDVDGRQSDGIITSSERWMYLLKISSALRPFVTIMPILLLLMRLSISFGTTSVIALSAEPVMRQDAIVSHSAICLSRRNDLLSSIVWRLVENISSISGQNLFLGCP